MLEDAETRIETLRNMLDEGEASGLAEYTYEQFIAEMDSENR
jgi:antitoxin ParD1/3/4